MTVRRGVLAEGFEKGARMSYPVHFLSDGTSSSLAELWSMAARGVAQLSGGVTVAAMLTASQDCVAVVLAAVRAGARLVSLPLPPRGTAAEAYPALLIELVNRSGADLLVVDRSLLHIVPEMAIPVLSFDQVLRGRGIDGSGEGFTLVQCSSGTTGDPRGIELGEAAIENNLQAILTRLGVCERQSLVSWLPLSHDMGLIGGILAPLYAGYRSVFINPKTFVQRPIRWLQIISDYGATTPLGSLVLPLVYCNSAIESLDK